MPDTHSQAQLQFARANAPTKNCNRACLSANAFLPTLKLFISGTAVLRLSGLMIITS